MFDTNIPADVALRVTGLFAASVSTDQDRTLAKAMLMQLAVLGVDRAEIDGYPALRDLLHDFTAAQ